MWFDTANNKIINRSSSISIDGQQYPNSILTIWSASDLKGIGILPYSEVKPNHNFYITGGRSIDIQDDEVIGTYSSTPRDLDELKNSYVQMVTNIAKNQLDNIVDKYSVGEMTAWPMLEEECKQFQEDATVGSTMQEELDLSPKYNTPDELAVEVIGNATTLRTFRATIIGIRQTHEIGINACDFESIKVYDVNALWPQGE